MRTVGYFQERLLGLLDRWHDESPLSSAWIRSGPIHVYMRKSPLPDQAGVLSPALTLASLQIRQGSQRHGTLTLILKWMADQHPCILKIENVITPQMEAIMSRPVMLHRGWVCNDQIPPSYTRWLRRA